LVIDDRVQIASGYWWLYLSIDGRVCLLVIVPVY
jgi:hypothetical protein